MTNEEKLKHFEDSVIGRANELSEESLKEFQETLDKEGKEYRDEKNQRALAKIKSEIGNLKRERNSVVARQQIDLKRQLTERTEELTAQLFEEVNEKLRGFRQTPDYSAAAGKADRKREKDRGRQRLYCVPQPGG